MALYHNIKALSAGQRLLFEGSAIINPVTDTANSTLDEEECRFFGNLAKL